MKAETRVLAVKCYNRACLGLILRGLEIDGAVAGRDCEELCQIVARKGYMGELRYYAGDCSCNLRPLPVRRLEVESFLLAASASLPLWLAKTLELIGRSYA